MAALVSLHLHSEIRSIYSASSSFPYLVLFENGPKAVEVEEETWWKAYWTTEEVEKVLDPSSAEVRSFFV